MSRRAQDQYSGFYSRVAVFVLTYAIAVQAALIGYGAAAAAGASTDAFALLCSQRDRGAPDRTDLPVVPSHNDAFCCTAAGCSGPAATPVQRIFVAAPDLYVRTVGLEAAWHDRVVAWPSERPRSSRAPPV